MKKLLSLLLVILAITATSLDVQAQTTSEKTTEISVFEKNYSLKLQNETAKRKMYLITFSGLNNASISRLINRMYSSSILAVVSRLSEENELSISTHKGVSLIDLNKELALLIELTKNDTNQSPVKF
jgi:hypothetical protein